SVLPVRGAAQARRKLLDRLVVEGIDANPVLARGTAELGCRVDLDCVREMAAAVVADVVVVEVLDERTAHRDVDDLLAAADAEHGEVPLAGLCEEPQLGVVEIAVDRTKLL